MIKEEKTIRTETIKLQRKFDNLLSEVKRESKLARLLWPIIVKWKKINKK